MDGAEYWVAFSLVPGIGRVKIGRLLAHFGGLDKAWHASPDDIRAAGVDEKAVRSILARRSEIHLDGEMDKLRRCNVSVLTQLDPSFPPRLKEIYDPPPLLYVRGSLTPEDEWAIAVVGTRHATAYGREVTEQLAGDLARSKVTVVSGLARGIDAVAHRAALAAGGRTIAVCACGLDMVYPAEHRQLALEIIDGGALVSAHPLGTRPKAENFPRRNRIMSGLTLGTLVTEAAERSGALITARMALEQDREVFAVPGSILSAASRGPNALIRDGAKAVLQVADILEELNLSMVPQQLELTKMVPENDTELVLLEALSQEPIHIDELCRRCHLPVATVSSALTMMELRGIVSKLGHMNYICTRGARVS